MWTLYRDLGRCFRSLLFIFYYEFDKWQRLSNIQKSSVICVMVVVYRNYTWDSASRVRVTRINYSLRAVIIGKEC